MSEWDNEVSVKEEIKAEMATAGDMYRVQDEVKVKVQIGELNEKNANCRVLHDLRMM